MIAARNYYAFRWAAVNGHLDVAHRLLQFPSVLAYAEMHTGEYGEKVSAFISEQLRSYRALKSTYEAAHPEGVFDIGDPEQSRLCFYMLRNLIRRNDPGLQDDLLFLMEIPSVRALLHDNDNELLLLAYSSNNETAAGLLLTIPAVHDLAVANDFCHNQRQGGLDLRALAADRESSMTGLTEGEQARLKSVTDKYDTLLKSLTVANVMVVLRETIHDAYEAHPAVVRTGDGREIELPLTYAEWETLSASFNADTRDDALKAYYGHPVHTAFRYLEKPNHWMAPHAVHVQRNAQGDGWSTFEAYQPLISLLFLAASDKDTAPIDGYTLETRVEHFIEELAHIGRAHNWDKHDRTYEYDDLEGDKPSCYSGVKRRLFQSVQGHPLLKLLTPDDIKEAARSLAHEHFKNVLEADLKQAAAIKEAWDSIVIDANMSAENIKLTSVLNIPEEAQAELLKTLQATYETSFTFDLAVIFRQQFEFTEGFPNHAMRFGGTADLDGLFKKHVKPRAADAEVTTEPQKLSLEAMRKKRLKMFDKPKDSNNAEDSDNQPKRPKHSGT